MLNRRTLLLGAAALTAPAWPTSAPASAGTRPSTWERLRRTLRGDLVLPGDPTYDLARQLDNGFFDTVRPRAVAYCTTVRDVRACLRFAQHHDIHTAVRSGGHSAAGYSTTAGLVLDVSRLDQIRVDRRGPHRPGTVTIGPGAQGVDVLATLAEHGLSTVTGNCPTVGAGGYLQGGGMGPLSRKLGVASDRLRSADVVLADGRLVRCSATREPDLFWALRGGGGGNFGVVTRYEIEPADVTRMVAFSLMWPVSAAKDVMAAYQAWLPGAPDDLYADFRVFWQDAGGASPPMVIVSGGWFGGGPTGLDPHLNELVSAVGTAPVNRSVDDMSYVDAMMRQFRCADKTVEECHRTGTNPEALLPRGTYVVSRGRLLDDPLDSAATDRALSVFQADPVAGQMRVMSMAGLGGAINRVPACATAYPHRDASFYLNFTVGLDTFTPSPDQQAAAESWAAGGFAVAARYGNGRNLVNFIDPRLEDWRTAYYGDGYRRLARTKRRYDRHGFFRFDQSVGR